MGDGIWIIEPLDPKNAYFVRKITDCRIICGRKSALGIP